MKKILAGLISISVLLASQTIFAEDLIEPTNINSSSLKLGDIDGNGTVDNLDLVLMSQFLIKEIEPTYEEEKNMDININDVIDISDIVLLKRLIMGDEIETFDNLKAMFNTPKYALDFVPEYFRVYGKVNDLYLCYAPSMRRNCWVIEKEYGEYKFYSAEESMISPLGLYLVSESEVYTLDDAYENNLIDIAKVYDLVPNRFKENKWSYFS